MATITEKIQNILKTIAVKREDETTKAVMENRMKLRELFESQHRMMYYTVTISSVSSVPTNIVMRKTSNLKWQYASTLCNSQAKIRRSTVHYPTYYNITYLEDSEDDDE